MDALLAALQIHGPIAAVAIGLAVWGKSHARSDDKRHHEVGNRFQRLEETQRQDLQRVYDSIQHVADQNTRILELLAQRR